MKTTILLITLLPSTLFAQTAQPVKSKDDVIVTVLKEKVLYQMKDVKSAQFRNLRLYRNHGMVVLCGELNGRNSFGGYVGFQPLVALGEGADGRPVDQMSAAQLRNPKLFGTAALVGDEAYILLRKGYCEDAKQ
jgi:hypothetical protein